MNNFKLLDDGKFVTEPACRLMEMYEYLIPRGRLIPAGSCGMVGIAGLTLGGGYGIFSREHGLAIDWLKRIRLIDGLGKIHEVEQGSDLFWACRGAGNGNFGVVTQLQFDTLKAPTHISRFQFQAVNLTPKRLSKIAKLWFSISAQLPNEAFSAFVHNGKKLNILVTSTLDTLTPGMSELLKQLEQAMDKRQPDNQQELLPGIRRYYGKLVPLNFKNASAGYYRSYADIENVAEKIFETVSNGSGLLFQINTLGGAIRKSGQSDAGGCYPHRDYAYLGEIQSYWEDPEQEKGALAAVAQVQQLLAGNGINAHYSNYPDINFDKWQTQYFGAANYTRLQAIKKQYDPDNVFRYPQSIEPS
jgi:FAD/FMN-containing dehydrogenase